jgi:hypothetical protein
MTILDLPGLTQTQNGPNACVVNDVVSMTLQDPSLSTLATFTLTTRPGGSSATMTSGLFTADVGGVYVATGAAGAATNATYTFYCFSTAMFASAGIGTYASGTSTGLTRPTDERRRLLAGICHSGQVTSAEFTSWVSGTFPATLNLAACGG